MQLSEITYDQGRPVDGYGPGFFRIAGEVFEGPVVVLPTSCGPWAGFNDPEPLVSHAADIDVVFVGTGAEISTIPPAFRTVLQDAGLGVETMNSPSACRTYNVLLSEGRRVALALIPV